MELRSDEGLGLLGNVVVAVVSTTAPKAVRSPATSYSARVCRRT